MKNVDNNLINEFVNLLNDNGSENTIQDFMEKHNELIPLPFLLNHNLHFNLIISKFRLGTAYVTDFAYLTKCSDFWEFVLIELEDSKKRIFTSNKNIYFSAEFNHAYDQILSWKSYVEDNREKIIKVLENIRVPLQENPVRIKYALIIGRNDEKDNSTLRRKMFAQKTEKDIRVMTYDSVISTYTESQFAVPKLIVSPWKENCFKAKIVPSEINTNIFAYVLPEYFHLNDEQIQLLTSQGYHMKIWLNNHRLNVNGRFAGR